MTVIHSVSIHSRSTMKTVTKILTTLTLSLSLVGIANASTLVAKNKSISTELCMAAASGSRISMNKAIRESRLSNSYVVYNIKCNEQNITDFVTKYGKSPKQMNALLNRGRTKGHVSINDIASL
jgi:hypothetical protein